MDPRLEFANHNTVFKDPPVLSGVRRGQTYACHEVNKIYVTEKTRPLKNYFVCSFIYSLELVLRGVAFASKNGFKSPGWPVK